MKYKLLISREGVNQVKVFKHQANGLYANEWNFSLKGDDEPIVLSEFYNKNQFAIINWNGWIRLFDADKKELLLDYKLNGNIDAKAIFSIDKSKIYIAFRDKDYQAYLATFEIKTLKIDLHEIQNYKSNLELRSDGSLLFYKKDWERVNNQKRFEHGFTVYNPIIKVSEYYSLPYAPNSSFGEVKLFINTKKNIGIMPYYGNVDVKKSHNEKLLFDFKIMLFDLNTFKHKLLSVRDFEQNQLDCNEYNCNDMASEFLNSSDEKNYKDAVIKFCDNLNSIEFVEDGFWLCWRGGILRKVYDDKILSPLLVTSEMSNSNMAGMFEFTHFHSYLYKIKDQQVFLFEHSDYYVFDVPKIVNQKSEALIPIQLDKITLEEIENLTYSNEKVKEILNLDKVLILVDDLLKDESLIHALQQIETKVTSLEDLGIGTKLVFQVEDKKGVVLTEEIFFEKVILLEEAPKKIQFIIEKFCQYPRAKYVYRNEEETALCHAVLELAKQGEDYLDIVIQYLTKIDLDHDVFNIENVIPLLEEKYTRVFLSAKIKSISDDLLDWYEFYCKEV